MNDALQRTGQGHDAGPAARNIVCGLIGWPVAHSLSPKIQHHAARSCGLDLKYLPIPVRPGKAVDAVLQARGDGLRGLNVTTPHKEDVVPLMGRLSEAAQQIGAVNTVSFETGEAVGYNTDYTGGLALLERLLASGKARGQDGAAVIFGTGPAARAIALAARWLLGEVTMLTRSTAAPLRGWSAGHGLSILPAQSAAATKAISEARLLVNATPLGSSGMEDQSPLADGQPLPSGAISLDLVYQHSRTPFISQAQAAGHKTINGLGLLCYQAADSFEIWTGERVSGGELLGYLIAEGHDAALSDGR